MKQRTTTRDKEAMRIGSEDGILIGLRQSLSIKEQARQFPSSPLEWSLSYVIIFSVTKR